MEVGNNQVKECCWVLVKIGGVLLRGCFRQYAMDPETLLRLVAGMFPLFQCDNNEIWQVVRFTHVRAIGVGCVAMLVLYPKKKMVRKISDLWRAS